MFASLLGAAFPLTRVPSSHVLRRTVKSLIGETKVQYYTHFDFRPAPADQPLTELAVIVRAQVMCGLISVNK